MPLQPGEAVFGGETAESRARASTSVSDGAAVTIDGNGDMDNVDTDANELIGVCGESDRLILSGAVVAAVDGAVAEGDRVAGGNTTNSTTGVFETSSGGPGKALCAAGGTWQGKDVPTGHAVVHL